MIAPIKKAQLLARTSEGGLGCGETRAEGAGISEAEMLMGGGPEKSDLTTWHNWWLCCSKQIRLPGDSTCTGELSRPASTRASADGASANTAA